ncbi:hypothetical protein CERSUDRAFT_120078 [Gelatoporia subvermispora B]|uniref:Uncharacterized protein n=1 Tax=Ceriporiopsis subvermispora (strain B) TaxID=914234 RepID=M2Q2S7_CERS8|nr:hypothetical protein CERSUDRAFT_120078 [Gelatoporia subvermispora B]
MRLGVATSSRRAIPTDRVAERRAGPSKDFLEKPIGSPDWYESSSTTRSHDMSEVSHHSIGSN